MSRHRTKKTHLEFSGGDPCLLFLFLDESRIDRVELAPLFGVGKHLVSLLNALEEGVVICVLVDVES